MEETLTKLMFTVPSDYTVEKVIVTAETVANGSAPELVHNPERKPVKITISNNTNNKKRGRKNTAS